MAYDELDPMADSWLQAGVVASTFANVMGGKNGKRLTPQDFVPRRKPSPRRNQSVAEGLAIMRSLAGRVNKNRRV